MSQGRLTKKDAPTATRAVEALGADGYELTISAGTPLVATPRIAKDTGGVCLAIGRRNFAPSLDRIRSRRQGEGRGSAHAER